MINQTHFDASKKMWIAIILGILTLLASPYGISSTIGTVQIDIPWSLFIPLTISMAFGWRYGLICGLSGAALFAFLLWPNNGYANIGTTLVFLSTYSLIGLATSRTFYKNITNQPIRLVIALAISITLLGANHIFIFRLLLSLNPAFWAQETINHLPINLLYTFVIKDTFNLVILTFISETLLRIPSISKLLGVVPEEVMADNTKIIIITLATATTIWASYFGLDILLFGSGNNHHLALAFGVIITCGFMVARLLIWYNENHIKNQIALQESEARYRLLTDNSSDMIARHDKEGRFLYVSSACNPILGYNQEDLVGHAAFEFIHPDDAQKVAHSLETIAKQRIFATTEFRILCKNGKYIWLETTSHFIRDTKTDELLEIHASSRDITTRKQADLALLESKANMTAIIENTLDSIWSINTSYEIIYINAVFQQAFSTSFGTLLTPGMNILLAIPEPIRPLWKSRYDRALKNVQFVFEDAIDIGSETIYLEVAMNPILVEGKVVGASFFSRDISPRRVAEAKLKESESRYKAITAGITDYLYTVTIKDGMAVETNHGEACALITGYTAKELEEDSFLWFNMIYDEDKEVARGKFECILAGERIDPFEHRIVRKDGSIRWLIDTIIPKYDNSGAIISYDGVIKDITDRKAAEAKIKDSEVMFSDLAANVPGVIYQFYARKDGKTGFYYLGPKVDAILGMSPNQSDPQWNLGALIHPDDKADFFTAIMTAIQEVKDLQYEGRLITSKGIVWIQILSRPMVKNDEIVFNGIILNITERKTTEQKLKESQRVLLESQAVGHIGAYVTDLKTNQWEATSELEKIFGIHQNDNYPHTLEGWTGIIHPASREKLFAYHREVIEQRKRFDHEYQIIRINDGEHRWVQGTGELEYDSDNNPVKMLGVIQDITERKQAEDALKSLATSYANLSGKAFFEAVTKHIALAMKLDYVYVGKIDSDKKSINVLGGTAFGAPMNNITYDLRNTPCSNIIDCKLSVYSTGIQSLYPLDELLVQMEIDAYIGTTLLGKNSEPLGILVALNKTPIQNTEMISDYFNFFTDRISAELQRLDASEELRKSEEKLSTLFGSMAEMVMLHELVYNQKGEVIDYRITDCNNAYTEITGIKREDAVGKLATELYQSEVPPFLEEYANVAITGLPFEYNNYYSPLDKHFMVSVVSPSKNTFATITTDITSMQQIQEAIMAKNQELENYLYITSHDLRSPLVNIQGFSQRLQKQVDSINKEINKCHIDQLEKVIIESITHESIPKTLDFIFTNVTKMDTLINGLLQISRTGRIKMSIKRVDANNLFQSIISSLNYQLTELGVTVEIGNLTDCYGDEALLNQLFTNIIGNAIKYRDKKRELFIEISSSIQFKRVIYTIKDNGIGINARHLEKIWEVFYRVDSTAPESGEGIGLSLVKRITDKHKGKIWVQSVEDVGTTFFIGLQRNDFTE